MKNWGIAVSVLYALVVVALAVPLGLYLSVGELEGSVLLGLLDPRQLHETWPLWVFVAPFLVTQAALLFIAVDLSGRRLKARRGLSTAVGATSFAIGLLSFTLLSSVMVAFMGDDVPDTAWLWLGVPAGLWIIWGIVFFIYRERLSDRLTQAVGWLLTAASVGDWYQTLKKPAWTPPDWVFGPVWTVLFVLMALAAWLVWRRAGWTVLRPVRQPGIGGRSRNRKMATANPNVGSEPPRSVAP